jgi:archaellum component FlaC
MTQGVEKDILAALEETIAALDKAIKDLEKNRSRPGQPASGEPGEPELVNKLAELKMIRSLQNRIYQRTQRYGEMIEGEQAETSELIKALEDLAERQKRVYRATADLQQGRND